MSLAHLLRSADARLRLDLVRPPTPRVDGEALPPSRLAPPLAASAVAYGIRLELARRDPAAERGAWPAERASARLAALAPEAVAPAERALALARGEGRQQAGVEPAEVALQLARLDAVVRAGYVDARIGEAEDREDVAEVAAMLARVPWSALGADLAPPPLFPGFADALPDAEPDALVDGTLLHVAAPRAPRVDEEALRALVARLVVARAEWGADEAAARVRDVGVLLARHGVLWRAPVAPIVGHEAFPAVEAWLLERLERARREAAPAEPDARPARATPAPKWVRKRFHQEAPGTHPEGKALKKKKEKAQSRPGAPPPPPRASRRAPPGPAPADAEGEPARRKPSRPDWRRNSPWRRERGL